MRQISQRNADIATSGGENEKAAGGRSAFIFFRKEYLRRKICRGEASDRTLEKMGAVRAVHMENMLPVSATA